MEIFLLGLALTIVIKLLCTVFIKNPKREKIIFLYLIGGFLAIVSGMRKKSIGTDTLQFYNAFQSIDQNNYGWLDYAETRYEIGYFWLNKIIAIFTSDSQAFLMITSFIIIIGIFYFIYRNSANVLYSVLLFQTMYYYCNSMNLTRQYIAVALAINSFTYIKQNEMIKACLFVIIGSSFHTSALLMLPIIYTLSKMNMNFKKINKVYIIIILGSFLTPLLINLTVTIFPRYEFYLTYQSDFSGGRIMPIVYISIIILGSFFLSHLKRNDEKNISYYYASIFLLIGAMLLIISNFYFESANRITSYFLIYFIIFVPELFKLFRPRSRMLLYGALLLFSTYYYVSLLNNGVAGVTPFKFYWQ